MTESVIVNPNLGPGSIAFGPGGFEIQMTQRSKNISKSVKIETYQSVSGFDRSFFARCSNDGSLSF